MTGAKNTPQHGAHRAEGNADCNVPAQSTDQSTATKAQRERILQALRQRPQTTEDLRQLGVYQAPARVKELRDRFGYEIETARVTLVDRAGYSHPRAALYSLQSPEGMA